MMPTRNQRGDWGGSLRRERELGSRDWSTALFPSILLGFFSADRFYVWRTGLGILTLLTVGGYVVWWLVNVIPLLQRLMRDDLGRVVQKPARSYS